MIWKKVYCSRCVFLEENSYELIYDCTCYDNVLSIEGDWYKSYPNYKLKPNILNKNNDCEWFQSK